MVRVLGSTGKMYNVVSVVPVVERINLFNGKTELNLSVARSLDLNPNGLLLLKKLYHADEYHILREDVMEYIGNISTADVREILAFMLADGFYNFSDWEYQQIEEVDDIKLDNGLSNPYTSSITNILDFWIY